ncbi:MAG: hypothetical protein HC906_03440 [Bacteroidales bacterium]|nr:hypothetical protein [Bacteroidales bacterium]
MTAVYDNDKLLYTGRVGTGFDDSRLKKIFEAMQPLKTDKPVVDAPDSKHVQWIRPEMVCEVRFSSWTDEKIMRAPSFMGLRTDKDPRDVMLEKPESNSPKTMESKAQFELPAKVKISNPDKIFWPDKQIKKIDVVNYYNEISATILPYLINRPQSLFRSPNGAGAPGFFQKDVKGKVPSWIQTIDVDSEDGEDKEYMLCQNRDTLVFMANWGCIEINPWNSSVPTLDNPDYVVFDLDPVENRF